MLCTDLWKNLLQERRIQRVADHAEKDRICVCLTFLPMAWMKPNQDCFIEPGDNSTKPKQWPSSKPSRLEFMRVIYNTCGLQTLSFFIENQRPAIMHSSKTAFSQRWYFNPDTFKSNAGEQGTKGTKRRVDGEKKDWGWRKQGVGLLVCKTLTNLSLGLTVLFLGIIAGDSLMHCVCWNPPRYQKKWMQPGHFNLSQPLYAFATSWLNINLLWSGVLFSIWLFEAMATFSCRPLPKQVLKNKGAGQCP